MDIFLSLQDPRELPKGSRDPLGFEVIWTRYGRRIVQNLTTITGSIEEFLTALYGFYLSQTEDEEEQRHRFLRYEQLAGYLREYANRHGDDKGGFVRGVTRVSERLSELENGSRQTLTLSPGKRDMILSNQTAYGLWGLYSTALDISGLIQSRSVTPRGEELAKAMADSDRGLHDFLRSKIAEDSTLSLDEIKRFSDRFAKLLHGEHRSRLLEILLRGKDESLQAELFDFIDRLDEDRWKQVKNDVWHLTQLRSDMATPLKNAFEDIVHVDMTLWLCNQLFEYLRLPQWAGKPLENIVAEIERKDPKVVLDELPSDCDDDLKTFRLQWNDQEYHQALETLLQRHAKIMQSRGGAPWVEKTAEGMKIRIEVPDAIVKLDKPGHAYDYFLGSYVRIYEAYREIRP